MRYEYVSHEAHHLHVGDCVKCSWYLLVVKINLAVYFSLHWYSSVRSS